MSTTKVVQTFKPTKKTVEYDFEVQRFNASLVNALQENFSQLIEYTRHSQRDEARSSHYLWLVVGTTGLFLQFLKATSCCVVNEFARILAGPLILDIPIYLRRAFN